MEVKYSVVMAETQPHASNKTLYRFIESPVGTNLNSPWLHFLVHPISNRFFPSRFRGYECILSIRSPPVKTWQPSLSLFFRLKQIFSHRTARKPPDTNKKHLKWLPISYGGLPSETTSTLLIGRLCNRRLSNITIVYMENIPRIYAKPPFS